MDERLEAKLLERYPKIFRVCKGMSCGNGWFLLLDEMCKEIVKVTKNKKVDVTAIQVKQKFGSLSFYYNIEKDNCLLYRLNCKIREIMWDRKLGVKYNKLIDFKKKFWMNTEEKISHIIQEAQSKSFFICEACGEPGKRRGMGWVHVACDECYKKMLQGKSSWRNPEEFPNVYEELFGKE